MKKIVFVFFSLLVFQCFSDESQKEIKKQIEEMMKARNEMMKSFFQDDADFEKEMENAMKNFGNGNPLIHQKFSIENNEYNSKWEETSTHRIFVLKLKEKKDEPIDVKIEEGFIKLSLKKEVKSKSKNQKVYSSSIMENRFAIPQDVDPKKPEFLNVNGEIHIKFKKLMESNVPKIKNNEERRPIEMQKKDVNI